MVIHALASSMTVFECLCLIFVDRFFCSFPDEFSCLEVVSQGFCLVSSSDLSSSWPWLASRFLVPFALKMSSKVS